MSQSQSVRLFLLNHRDRLFSDGFQTKNNHLRCFAMLVNNRSSDAIIPMHRQSLLCSFILFGESELRRYVYNDIVNVHVYQLHDLCDFGCDDVELSRQLLSVGMREHTQELAAIVGFSLKCHKLKQRANSVTILQQQKMDNAVRRSIFFICIRAENRDSTEAEPGLGCM